MEWYNIAQEGQGTAAGRKKGLQSSKEAEPKLEVNGNNPGSWKSLGFLPESAQILSGSSATAQFSYFFF